jgi:molybdenum cofactor cytidylyltransferase
MIFALIPAAGKSVRMGRPKLMLPLGGRTVLECLLHTLQRAEIEHILVVTGPHVPELGTIAEVAGAHVLPLSEETPDMRATVERGLAWLEQRFHPRPDDHWLLVPADHPTLDETVIRQLVQARQHQIASSIAVPAFQGKRGHPALIDWRHAENIRALPGGVGLNVYLRQHMAETLEVAVTSPDVLWDLDTPEDYERIARSWRASP